ncbi:acyl-CoA dehydrogenase family protein [Dactylosporangium fulvum]|uniref:Acyl-CoA/acyl-ACP dehydrogenase n=1 Tax=Dactylosporangium fulvum TaxID=53359 RepID=A0ABY5VP29_9ACTN|nr:acyl-CoA dehydrogenase family protein [Dactylosporangium fulvum]UWP78920.1 acyl-CoA/acyl-ACP dehydrogenase [Dactylosporangium fulvum]
MTATTTDATAEVLGRADDILADLARLAPGNDRSGVFPTESIRLLHEAGLLTATVGTRYGGPGLRHAGVYELMLRLGRADPSVALIASMNLAVHQREAVRPTLDPQFYAALLAESRTAPTLVNALQVEPALGTPSRGGRPATTARRTADGWRVTGHKIFSTGAPGLRWMFVLATTDEPEPRVGTFVVDAHGPGVEIRPAWSAAGMRATCSDDVVLTDAAVPAERVCGLEPAGDGHRNPQGPGTAIPAIYLGVAEAARDWLVGFLRERVPANLGHPLVELPRFQAALGEIGLRLTAARELLAALSAQADAGRDVPRETAWAAKTVANRAAIRAVEHAVSLIGNPGLSTCNPLERHLRDVLCARVHFPQEDTVVAAFGSAATSPTRKAS